PQPRETKEYITFGDNGQGLPKLKAEKDLVCHPCRHGKMVAASYTPMSQVMTPYPGELLDMDTVGPARVASVSGKWYVLVVVDNFLRFSWVFFMEFKDEAFGLVRDLFSSSYTPPQNGAMEHKNRTLVEMARMMLDEHRTPRRFWAEAVNTACYIANRIFLYFVLKKAGHMDKYESRCLDEIFLAYASSSGAVWILETKQVVETCEVSFDETMPCTTTAFELLGDYEEGSPIFEDEEVTDDEPLHRLQILSPLQQTLMMKEDLCPWLPPHSPDSKLKQRLAPMRTRGGDLRDCSISAASFETRDVSHALSDPNWVNAMHEELENFERNHETFAPIARLEAIRILLAFAASKGIKLQQMDVKSAFPNGFIEEEVFVRQPPGFESAKFPDWVYKLRKALYGLKQASRAWYAWLKSFLLKSGFVMGSVDKTLFLLSSGGDTLIVQIYVDDIIFGGSSHTLVSSFPEQMSREFEMSLMGELQFFLGLQIKQGSEGTFVHQDKYTRDILKKFDMGDSKPMTTPMSTNTVFDADEDGEAVDQKEF
ncbi:hypothetical protein U9M48_003610, partial [Paspalum notatum var. saurae]